jgi:cystine transport system permease protein
MRSSLELVWESLPMLAQGAGYTIVLSVGSMAIGLLIGLAVALARLYPLPVLSRLASFFVSFIRGTPLLVQLFLIYYGLGQLGLRLDPIPSAFLGFSLNIGGYTSEIIRSAILSVDHGQWEAAQSIGMSQPLTLRRVILPQAARVALAPLGNSFISLVKDTSLAATIQVPELFRQAQLITARTFQVFTMYVAAAAIYWLLSSVLARGQTTLEARFSAHVRRK